MTTYHEEYLLDRAEMAVMRALLAVQPKLRFGPEARPDFDALTAKTPESTDVKYEAATLGGVAGWWCKPPQPIDGSAIAYFHGGAYVLGSAAAYRNFVGQIAVRANAAIFVAEYGLAPERKFPVAVEDADAVYRGLVNAGFSRIGIAGDSAGGGLALALLQLVTEAAEKGILPKPLAAVVMSPWADLALTGESILGRAKADPLLTREGLEDAAQLYLGDQDRRAPKTSPLYGDCAGLPPVLLHVSEDEILLDDSCRFASRVEPPEESPNFTYGKA